MLLRHPTYDRAQNGLGYLYASGFVVERDYRRAVAYWRQASQQGNLDAQVNLGLAYDRGRGVVRNVKRAVAYYRQAAASGDREACTNLALMLLNEQLGPPAVAQRWFLKAARLGDVLAQFHLGSYYLQGTGGRRSLTLARKWFTRAANAGYRQAAKELAALPPVRLAK